MYAFARHNGTRNNLDRQNLRIDQHRCTVHPVQQRRTAVTRVRTKSLIRADARPPLKAAIRDRLQWVGGGRPLYPR